MSSPMPDATSFVHTVAEIPFRFRRILKSKDGDANDGMLAALKADIARVLDANKSLASPTQLCICRVLATEVETMGGIGAASSARRLQSVAHVACFRVRWIRWLEVTEELHPGPVMPRPLPPMCPPRWEELQQPAYLQFDTTRYDFQGVLLRLFASVLGSLPAATATTSTTIGCPSAASDPASEALSMLHATSCGERELGYAHAASVADSEELRTHTKVPFSPYVWLPYPLASVRGTRRRGDGVLMPQTVY